MPNILAVLALAMQTTAPAQAAVLTPPAAVKAEPAPSPAGTLPRLPFDPPRGTPLRYRISHEYEGEGAPPPHASEQTLTFATLSDGDLEMTIVTHSLTFEGRTYRAEDDPPELPHLSDVLPLLGPVRLRMWPGGTLKRIENWADVSANMQLSWQRAIARVEDEAEQYFLRRMEGSALAQADAESSAPAAAGVWAALLSYGGMPYVRGERARWSNSRPFLNGAAQIDSSYMLSVAQTADGTYLVDREQVIDPQRFAEAVDEAWLDGDGAAMEEAERLKLNGEWMNDVTRTILTSFRMDAQGVIQSGTIGQQAERRGGKGWRLVTTVELVE